MLHSLTRNSVEASGIRWCPLLASLLLCACAHNPVPDGYKGPLSKIGDSVFVYGEKKVDLFFVQKVNDQKIANSLSATVERNQGRGFRMTPVVLTRDVPSSKSRFHIVGRTHFSAPILELTHTTYQVEGDVEFSPIPGAKYLVKGVLCETYSAVWVEEEATAQLVAPKIEIHGSAALGFFEK